MVVRLRYEEDKKENYQKLRKNAEEYKSGKKMNYLEYYVRYINPSLVKDSDQEKKLVH